METGGLLYGVGLGPGDPELVTVKALRILRGCDVLVLPEKEKTGCRACAGRFRSPAPPARSWRIRRRSVSPSP